MRSGWSILLTTAVFGLVTVASSNVAADTTNAMIRAVGVSGQIHTFCADAGHAAQLASICEDIRSKLVALLGVENKWKSPVVVVFRRRPVDRPLILPGESSPLRCSVASVSGFLRYQIEAEVPPPVDASRFVEAMVGTLCAEWVNRKYPRVEGGQQIARPPAWLVTGLARRLEERRRETALEPLKQAFAAEKMPGFRILTMADGAPADPAGAALYGAQCDALLAALEGQSEGRRKLQKFLLNLDPGENWMRSFCAAFGDEFHNPVKAEKWWSLVMVRSASLIVAQAQSAAETRQRLAEALVVVVPAGEGAQPTPRGFWSFLWPFDPPPTKQVAGVTTLDQVLNYCNDPKALWPIVAINEARLQTLISLSHPLYRGAIMRYIEAVHWLRDNDLSRFQQCMVQAAQIRQRADRDCEAISNFVGSVEASLFPEDMAKRLGAWFKAGGTADAALPAPTPMTLYLDRVESNLQR